MLRRRPGRVQCKDDKRKQQHLKPTAKFLNLFTTPEVHGMVHYLSIQDVFSVGAITKYFARAVELLKVPWPARPDAKPIVTPQDVTNICKVRERLLSLYR